MAPNRSDTTSVTDRIRHWLTRVGELSAHPGAFLILGVYAALWVAFQPETLGWPGVAVLATWFMTLIIQRAEHRDTQALQAKLDELLRANANARNELTKIDREEPEDIIRHRTRAQSQD